MGKDEKKITEAEKHAFKFYDSETGELLGRTLGSWAKIGIFYLAYFSFLTGLFIASLQIMQKPLDDLNKPLLNTRLNIPGLNMFPKYDLMNTDQKARLKKNEDIEFLWKKGTKDGDQGYQYYVDQTKDVLAAYTKTADASEGVTPVGPVGDECSEANSFGWEAGTPCIFIRLNRVIDWTPVGLFKPEGEGFTADSLTTKMKKDAVYIRCTAGPVGLDEPIEETNMPTFKYFSGANSDGYLDQSYFPYKGKKVQPNYQSPMVAVQITNISENRKKPYKITCRAFAKNIVVDEKNSLGAISFQMKAESDTE